MRVYYLGNICLIKTSLEKSTIKYCFDFPIKPLGKAYFSLHYLISINILLNLTISASIERTFEHSSVHCSSAS